MATWTQKEDQVLREMYAKSTRGQIARTLGRSEGSVRSRCWTLRLNAKLRKWTNDELDLLREAYSDRNEPVDLEALAKIIGRDKANVCRKARLLGLGTNQRRNKIIGGAKPRQSRRITKSAEELSELRSKILRERIASGGPLALGVVHSSQAKKKMSQASKRAWEDPRSGLNCEAQTLRRTKQMYQRIKEGRMRSGYSRGAQGKREDLGGLYVRSSWEANYARFLEFLKRRGEIRDWKYESRTFEFEPIKRGTRFYTPDFEVTLNDGGTEWHEVKGWMDQASKTRLSRMAKYYPHEKILLIDQKWFDCARRSGLPSMIPGWEKGGRRNGAGT